MKVLSRESLALVVGLFVPAITSAQTSEGPQSRSASECPAPGAECGAPAAAAAALEPAAFLPVMLQGQPQAQEPAFLGVFLDEAGSAGEGVTIAGVVEGSAADKAGLRAGDRIVEVGEQAVANAEDLRQALSRHHAGDAVRITFLRDEERLRSRVTLGRRTEEPDVVVEEPQPARPPRAEPPASGLRLRPLPESPGLLGITVEERGEEVLVGEVMEGTAAQSAGLRAGDVILSVNDEPVETAQDVVDAVRQHSAGDTVTLSIRRGDGTRTVEATLGAGEEPAVLRGAPEDQFRSDDTRRMLEEARRQMQEHMQEMEARLRDREVQRQRELEELRAENRRLRQELEQRRSAPEGGGARRPAGDVEALRQQLDDLQRSLRDQQRILEDLRRRIERGGESEQPAAATGTLRFVPRDGAGAAEPHAFVVTRDGQAPLVLGVEHDELSPRTVTVLPARVGAPHAYQVETRIVTDPRKTAVLELRGAKDATSGVGAHRVEVKEGKVLLRIGDETREIPIQVDGKPQEFRFKVGDHGEGRAIIVIQGTEKEPGAVKVQVETQDVQPDADESGEAQDISTRFSLARPGLHGAFHPHVPGLPALRGGILGGVALGRAQCCCCCCGQGLGLSAVLHGVHPVDPAARAAPAGECEASSSCCPQSGAQAAEAPIH